MNNLQISQSFPLWSALLFLLISSAIVIFFYYRIDKPLSRRYRYILTGFRIFSIAGLIFCLLNPTLTKKEEIFKKTNLLFLVDNSQSMSLTDSEEKTTRIDIIKKALTEGSPKPIIEDLMNRFSVQLYQFSSDVSSVKELSLKAQGTLTDISKALLTAIDDWKGQPIAGVVLVTDGSYNSGEDPIKTVQKTGIPIYTVGVGQAKVIRDIQITRVEASPIAYIDHTFPIKVAINSGGYDGREVRITLNSVDSAGGSSLKDSAALKLDSKNGEQIVELQMKPQQEGILKLNIAVTSMSDELTTQNNVYTFFVRVVKTKIKVMYIEGKPRWESTFLNRALQKDPNIELSYLVVTKQGGFYPQSALKNFPTRNELFSSDVLIIGDISPSFFKGDQLSMIKDFVENKGGSLVLLAGKNSFGDNGFGESSIKDMLPIDIGQGGARHLNSPFNPVLTQQGFSHPSTRLSDDSMENTAIWKDLPSLNSFYSGVGTKLGATVLAEHQQEKGKPLIAFQRYGKGMTFMITSDDLWTWAFGVYTLGEDDSYYRRFWSGTIRWLSSVRTQADQVNVEPGKQTYTRDEKVNIKTYVYNENYDPVSDAQIKAQVRTPAGTLRDIKFVFEENGRYSAEFLPTMDGNHKVEVEAERLGRPIGKGSAEFIVQTATLEYQSTQLNEPMLKQIADISGGSYYNISNISELPQAIKEIKESNISIKERSIWDNAWMLGIVLVLLTTEWLLRKKKGLV
jgi:uncharacterized membrane protein